MALLCVAGGVAPGLAAADPLPVADVRQAVNTEDGWRLGVSLTQMTVNSVPNMAATAFTREGFVTGRAEASIDGSGSSAVNNGTLIVGLQLGCQVDLSEGASVGGDADIVNHKPHPVARIVAYLCFAIVILAILYGIAVIVSHGLGIDLYVPGDLI